MKEASALLALQREMRHVVSVVVQQATIDEPAWGEAVEGVQVKTGEDGQADAERDIETGQCRYYVVGQPMAHDALWRSVLRQDYGIQLVLLGCTPMPSQREYAAEYNAVMVGFLKKKFGDDIFSATEAAAREQREDARQEADERR